MNWLNLLGISVGLAMDALAVSIAAGLSITRITRRRTFRIAFHFGLFQFMMPVLGWLVGSRAASRISAYDHWIVFGLLALIGGKMLLDAGKQQGRPKSKIDPTRGWMLITLSVATSLDALAVGVSMGLLGVSIWIPSVVIGLVAAAFSAVGFGFGSRLGPGWGRWAEVAGGCILLAIGLRILVSHLLA